MKRVVVTGMGVISPVGSTLPAFWDAVERGESAVAPLHIGEAEGLKPMLAAKVQDYDPAQHFSPRQLVALDRTAQFAVLAAKAAVADAGIEFDEETALTTATVVGVATGGGTTIDEAYFQMYRERAQRIDPLTIPRYVTSAAASQVSIALKLQGPAYAVASACASGAHAIGQGLDLIRAGRASVAVVGAAEACLTYGVMRAWEALRIVSPDACRPFSRNRTGMVPGEGAAILVLEERESAMRRGARIYAEIAGFGMSADAADMLAPTVDGAARAMSRALADARMDAGAVRYINAHGTATMMNDRTECRAIRMAFGSAAEDLEISSSKAVIGHAIGAAGALEAVVTLLAMDRKVTPPTANHVEPDPECGLDVVPNVARDSTIGAALSNSFGFGGLNASVAFASP